MGKRGPKNKILNQPQEVVDFLKSKIYEKGMTIKKLKDIVNNHPACTEVINEGSLWGWLRDIEEEQRENRELDEYFARTSKNIDFKTENQILKYIGVTLSKILAKHSSGKKDISIKETFLLSKALRELTSASKDREKVREQIEKELREKALQKIEETGKAQGLTEEIIASFKKALST